MMAGHTDHSATRAKVVIIGDGGCGKTCDLIVFSQGRFPEEYVPTVFETRLVDITVDKQPVELVLNDTAGQEDFADLRVLSYKDADAILLCFALDSPTSFLNIKEKWAGEVHEYAPKVPLILVGNKSDLRGNPAVLRELQAIDERPVETSDGESMAEAIGAQRYMECSARDNTGLTEIFEQAALYAMEKLSKGTRKRNTSRGDGDDHCPICSVL